MILEIIQQQIEAAGLDVKQIGWSILGIYVALFAIAVIKGIFGVKKRRHKQDLKDRRDEANAKLAEIRLRLAEIRLEKEELALKALQEDDEDDEDEDEYEESEEMQQLDDEEFDLEEERKRVEANLEQYGPGF